jgi:AcrR family transcriptional regulator
MIATLQAKSQDRAGTAPAAPSQRERAKDGRRRRIVNAAHDLLRSEPIESLSVKAIALRAGVSLSTLYNLFGSKDAVLIAVSAQDLADYEALVRGRTSLDALERLFDAIDVAMKLYQADPAFYRATMARRTPGEPLDAEIRQPRNRFWENLVEAAKAEGTLRADTEVATLGRVLVYLFGGALGDWIAGDLELDRFARDIAFGFAAALLPFATPSAEQRLRARLARTGEPAR